MKKSYKESWKKVRGLEKYYLVSNHGNLISLARIILIGKHLALRFKEEKVIKPRIVRGYHYVMLEVSDQNIRYRKNKALHRLVAEHFIPNKEKKPEVNHIDGNKFNNKSNNLEWVTRSENQLHAVKIGLRGKPIGKRKFSDKEISMVWTLRKKGKLHREIAKQLKMGVSTVTHILGGTRRS